MSCPNLERFEASAATAQLLASNPGSALASAEQQLGVALGDLAMVHLAEKRPERAMPLLLEAVERCPRHRKAFHNLVAGLLMHGQLRGRNLQQLAGHVQQLITQGVSWAQEYDFLRWLPDRLSLVPVAGRCNLKCRMCVGANRQNRNTTFRFVTAKQFAQLLQNATTITRVSLAPGDSDSLMHPDFDKLIILAQQHGVSVSLFSNAVALTPQMGRLMVDSGAIASINFSLDAATPETYQRIRGTSFDRVLANIAHFVEYGRQPGRKLPRIEFSFVAMADNIEELPAFVELAQRYSAAHINLQDLTGWDNAPDSGNRVASENPRWQDAVIRAQELAREKGISLYVANSMRPRRDDPEIAPKELKAESRCSWMEQQALWVYVDGTIRPCCHGTSAGTTDLGNLFTEPLYRNERYNQVMREMHGGRVFGKCLQIHACNYIAYQAASGRTPPLMSAESKSAAAA